MRRGIARLERQIQLVQDFSPGSLDPVDPRGQVRPLAESVKTALSETFGHDSQEFRRFSGAASFDWPINTVFVTPHRDIVRALTECRTRSLQLLGAALDLLHDRLEIGDGEPADTASAPHSLQTRIFVVHGHDEGPKEAVARFLERLGYEPVILHEQANKGRTIIQKFQDEASDVGFAVVLMTPDDEMPSGARRARQNVILELGFFIGRLGPQRVSAIVKGNVETPSDFDGIVYIAFDSGWKQALAKELSAAGYAFDWNKVMT
jgi:hypothetical protein